MDIEKSTVVTVKFQWGKQKFDFELDRSDDLDTVKAKLYSLTFVPTEKQKILYKGKMIKEDEQLKTAEIANGAILMLMGTAEGKEIQAESLITTTKFIEELTPAEQAKLLKEKTGAVVPYGLVNLGNTCYINSTLQVMAKIPEFKKALQERKNMESMGPPTQLVKALANVFHTLETSGDTVKPYSFIQFAETDKESGAFQQQDADECFQGILSTLEPAMKGPQGINLLDQLFSFEVMYRTKNQEAEEEEEGVSFERLRRLPCIIDADGAPINQITEGILVGLEGTLEKMSSMMERNCIYKKTGRLSSLPSYMIVQKIRFIWKEQDKGTRNKAQKAKILRAVTFPKVLDVAPFCTPEMQAEFKETRKQLKEREDERLKQQEQEFEEFKKQFEKNSDMDTQKISKLFKEKKQKEEIEAHERDLWRSHEGNKSTGNYELIGVITHKGRSADSGHYLGWTYSRGDEWYRFDDDEVTKVKTEDILALRGGGDWHMAYYLIYRQLVTDLK